MVYKLKFYCENSFNNCVVTAQTFQTFTLLDAAGISGILVLNQNAIAKEREAGSFSNYAPKNLQRLYTGWCCLWVCPQFRESYQSTNNQTETIFAFKTFLYKIYSGHAYIQDNEGTC